jgi:hypothetical protein
LLNSKANSAIQNLLKMFILISIIAVSSASELVIANEQSSENLAEAELFTKEWNESDLRKSAPLKNQSSTMDKAHQKARTFFWHMGYHEKKYKKISGIETQWNPPTKENLSLYAAYNYEIQQHVEPKPESTYSAIRTSFEYAAGKSLSENSYMKSLINGFSLEVDPFAVFSERKERKVIAYTIEADYLASASRAPESASQEIDYYEIEGAGKLRPVYKVVPVFESEQLAYSLNESGSNSKNSSSNSDSIIEDHNDQMELLSALNSLEDFLDINKEELVKFRTKVVPVRGSDSASFTYEVSQKAGLYKFTKNTNESDYHHYYHLPLTNKNTISHQEKGKSVSKSSLSIHSKKYLSGVFSFEKNHIATTTSAIYSKRLSSSSYTLKSSFDKDYQLSKLECILSLRLN